MRPTPVLKGKSAEIFYNNINQGEISEKQQTFLKECVKLLKRMKRDLFFLFLLGILYTIFGIYSINLA